MNTYEYQKLRGLKRKLFLVDQRGGCCEICGYNKNLAAFEFHHKDPNEKENNLDMRKLSNSTMQWIEAEFDKCLVVCANCHREVHNEELIVKDVRERVKDLDETILKNKPKVNKPNCCDCGIEINYTYKRCRPCNEINKRVCVRPEVEELKKEITEHSVMWCANKYGVSHTTIGRWKK